MRRRDPERERMRSRCEQIARRERPDAERIVVTLHGNREPMIEVWKDRRAELFTVRLED